MTDRTDPRAKMIVESSKPQRPIDAERPKLSAYELIERVRKASARPQSVRDYLAVEIMAAYLLIASDPTDIRSKCYQVADDLVSNRPRW